MALGVVMLCSTGIFADEAKNDLYYNVKRQAIWLTLGMIAMITMALIDYRFWQKFAWIGYGLCIVLLICCFIPGIAALNSEGKPINGSYRWLSGAIFGMSSLRLQPSEFAKIATLIFLASWFARNAHQTKRLMEGFLVPCLILAVPALCIVLETDLGTTALLTLSCLAVMFIAGTRFFYLGTLATVGVAGLSFVIYKTPERIGRLLAFMDIEKHKMGDALQAYRSVLAFGSGGVEGVGLGNGRQKMDYLPFAHTDFIFPMIGEELGLFATLSVVLAFVIIAVCGSYISASAPDAFGKFLGFGLVVMIVGQAIINIGVTTAVLPTKGIPLPFVSYGGSNLLCCLISLGIIINIARQAKSPKNKESLINRTEKLTPKL